MSGKRHTPEQIVVKLREADALLNAGQSLGQVIQHLGVLENARLIITRKAGRSRWNYLDVSPIQRIHQRWIEAYAEPSANLLSKLQQDLEAL